jgi:hypothetical protein
MPVGMIALFQDVLRRGRTSADLARDPVQQS